MFSSAPPRSKKRLPRASLTLTITVIITMFTTTIITIMSIYPLALFSTLKYKQRNQNLLIFIRGTHCAMLLVQYDSTVHCALHGRSREDHSYPRLFPICTQSGRWEVTLHPRLIHFLVPISWIKRFFQTFKLNLLVSAVFPVNPVHYIFNVNLWGL